ncbi:MAG: DUF971 domain-containing protein [Silvibacterium sp.]
MSHEGIRFVSKEQAQKDEHEQRELPHAAKEPIKVRVHKTEGSGLEIDWKDGHHSAWTFAWLRNACPCATCHEEREQSGRAPGEPKPHPATLLPMYQAPSRPESVTPVGNYALSFTWNDGHKTGIYSWDYLRRHCQCGECRAVSDH